MKLKKSPPALVALFDSALPEDPRVERRKLFGFPAAFAGGNMFAGLFEDSCLVRLPEAERETLRTRLGGKVFAPVPGRPMREYTVLPETIMADRASLRDWLGRGLAYAVALPPKTPKTKRRKKS